MLDTVKVIRSNLWFVDLVFPVLCRLEKRQDEQGDAAPGFVGVRDWRPQGKSFCFCSANVCLLPDSLARFNNLSDTQRRAREVGKRIRNGACRPQIKIYIDSPTNTSIRYVDDLRFTFTEK